MILESANTDWVGSHPIYYNEKTGLISHNINEVIDFNNLSINADGLRNYLKFGYTAYGQTMVDNVRVLDHCSHIEKDSSGKLVITQQEDIAEGLWNPGQKNGSEVFEMIMDRTVEWADSLPKESDIVVPLSGGFDSKLLAYALRGRENVFCYSYGLSARQADSFEVVKAKQAAEKSNLYWKQLDIVDFLREDYLDRWFELYGPAVHLHGMYQMEFFDKIITDRESQRMNNGIITDRTPASGDGCEMPAINHPPYEMLSGIVGDVWAGKVRIAPINGVDELGYIGFTHGINVDDSVCLLKSENENARAYYEKYKDKFAEESWRVLYAIRFKMSLLHYLLKTPESMGMNTWSPFTDPEVCMAILNLDWSEKEDRIWQQREFEKLGMNYGWQKDICDYNMVLNVENHINHPLKPLNSKILSPYIKESFVEEVNRQITRRALRAIPAKPRTAANLYNKAVWMYNKKIDEAIVSYKILGSLERLLIKAER